jgi:hypothetical protein
LTPSGQAGANCCFDGRAGALLIAVAPMPAGEERREVWFV